MLAKINLLVSLYRAFNTREIDAALSAMHPDVDWPNGMEGGRVHGREAVRDYWINQWKAVDSYAEPVKFSIDQTGHIIIDVHIKVLDLKGSILVDQNVQHVYDIRDDLIVKMDIRS